MRLLSVLMLVSLLLTACSAPLEEDEIEIFQADVQYTEFVFPNAVQVLGEISTEVPLPQTKLLETGYIRETLDASSNFPGTYLVPRVFTEQLVNTLLSLGHSIAIDYVTDIFIYLHMEHENYTYLVWWSNNQLMLAGDFAVIRESFLR